MPGACSLPIQGFSWRQLISQPLYPERMPAEGQLHDHDSKAPVQAHAADTRRDHAAAAAAEGSSCPHCSASIDGTHCCQCALKAGHNRAWSADLCKGIPAVQNFGSAVLKTSLPGRMLGAPERGTEIRQTHGRGKDTVQRPVQHTAQHAAASTRSSKHSRLSAARQSSPRLSPQGKENANQQRQKPLPPGDHSGRLQISSNQRRVKAPAVTAKNACESPRYGSPRSAQTSNPSTPRLSTKGTWHLQWVAGVRCFAAYRPPFDSSVLPVCCKSVGSSNAQAYHTHVKWGIFTDFCRPLRLADSNPNALSRGTQTHQGRKSRLL